MAKKTKKESKTKVKGSTNAKSEGRTLGLGMEATWVHIFSQNAKTKPANRKTDAQLLAFMRKEFPDRDSQILQSEAGIRKARASYNRGYFHDGQVPKTLSVGYDKKGSPIAVVRGRPKSTTDEPPTKRKKDKGKKGKKGKKDKKNKKRRRDLEDDDD